jgi:hypothetical protein
MWADWGADGFRDRGHGTHPSKGSRKKLTNSSPHSVFAIFSFLLLKINPHQIYGRQLSMWADWGAG